MSESDEQRDTAQDGEAETTIVNTASVAAKTAGSRPTRGQTSPAAQDDGADAQDADGRGDRQDAPLIPEPAAQPIDGAVARGDGRNGSDPADGTDDGPAGSGLSSVRQKARSLAHSLGDFVGLSDDGSEPADPSDDDADEGREDGGRDGYADAPEQQYSTRPAAYDDVQEDYDGSDTRLTGAHPEFNNAFDIIDQLEGELDDAKPVLFHSSEVRVDRQAMLDHLSELRDVLPVQLERASALMREAEQRRQEASERSEKIVRGARDEKDRILEEAHHRADILAGQENVVTIARQKAQAILKDANSRARSLTQGADTYVEEVLTKLSEQLADFTKQTRGGISVIQQREQEASRRFEQTRQQALHPGSAPVTPATGVPAGLDQNAQNGQDSHE